MGTSSATQQPLSSSLAASSHWNPSNSKRLLLSPVVIYFSAVLPRPLESEFPAHGSELRAEICEAAERMDDYPQGSLDPAIPLLLTLGVAAGSGSDQRNQSHGAGLDGLDASLKEQAVLIRSGIEPLDTEQALALLRYIQEHDAARLPWKGRETPLGGGGLRYRFRVSSAERVRSSS